MLTRLSPVQVPAHEQHWLDTVESLAKTFAETVASDDAEARLPIDHLRALSATGLDTAFLPIEHGGEALSYATLGQVVRTLAAAHPAVATVWLMHIGAAHALVSCSQPAEAEFFAAELRAGKRFSNALSEPAGGNYFLNSQQDAEAVEDGWVLEGRKLFVSGSEAADHLFLNSRVDGAPAFFGVTVDDTISFPPIDETSGMRATRSRSMTLSRTPLLASRLCAPPAPDYSNLITVGFGFVSIGIAESALDALKDYATSRRSPQGTLGDAQWVKSDVGPVWAEVRAARLMAEQVSWLADQKSPDAMPAATETKMLANEVAKKAAALAVRVGGGSGYLVRSPIQRIFRDAQAGALMAYSVPFSEELVGGWVLDAE
ncbi:alkylation response protein AidB-like acyl-CoA dehydrogenase [Microbacterium halimionae]|uniref:Alkylation response protein AidB-like acyl-CoA dehydrogenase n=1 Tax=Microbacterium halimionae TaxID=1526413 RepID=A0A7W3JQH3_9MICO|nr:acyl-CoA dehydrogenase family protein [Microbacterium halimionae]MBA8817135.1 alkylation response protein AidB-like acyl-CoA dehydrogenase [Microbacterium halimionae]NII94585.1 alkylation response protein AidB-like acyl-CoA dehydrogenase [Microbacterium halimionae]